MIDEKEVLGAVGVQRETLHVWIERGWVEPAHDSRGYRFREIDVARLELIREFHTTFELTDDAMDVVLPLLDQVHGLRRQMRRLAQAVSQEPEDVRERIAAALSDGDE